MKNIAMRITYDGTGYHGWQRQSNAISVQQTVEEALREMLGGKITVTGCSRTDAGVHALDYVFNFKTDTSIPTEKLPYALNYRLDRGISALDAWEVEADFNARFSARGKEYVYRIFNSKMRNPFEDRYSWFVPYNLDFEAMRKASVYFEGTHDFSAFMAAGGDQKTTVRTIKICSVERSRADARIIKITVGADAFLYNMVRIIAGTLADVGFHKIPYDDIPKVIESGERIMAGRTAPPEGLFLKKVFYGAGEIYG